MDNEFYVNPYIELHHRAVLLKERTLKLESETLKFHDEFLKVFRPDQITFDTLKDQAREAITCKKPQNDIDALYYKMAMIYKEWLPIEDHLLERNPDYKKLFNALKFMIIDIQKKKDKNEIGQSKRAPIVRPKRRNEKT